MTLYYRVSTSPGGAELRGPRVDLGSVACRAPPFAVELRRAPKELMKRVVRGEIHPMSDLPPEADWPDEVIR